MSTQSGATLLAFQLAEEIPPVPVEGAYDAEAQLWLGGEAIASCTTWHSGTNCHTAKGTSTNCGYDGDAVYDNCADTDVESD